MGNENVYDPSAVRKQYENGDLLGALDPTPGEIMRQQDFEGYTPTYKIPARLRATMTTVAVAQLRQLLFIRTILTRFLQIRRQHPTQDRRL